MMMIIMPSLKQQYKIHLTIYIRLRYMRYR